MSAARRAARTGAVLALTITLPLSLARAEATGEQPQSETELADAPLLAQPDVSVGPVGFAQAGQRLELGALLTNRSTTLDAREATVVLVAFDEHGDAIAGALRGLQSIPADSTVAVAALVELKRDLTVKRAEAHLSLTDAAVTRAAVPLPLPTADVSYAVSGGDFVVSGHIQPGPVYPVTYEVEAVLLDAAGGFVAATHGEMRPKRDAPSQFTARGALPSLAPDLENAWSSSRSCRLTTRAAEMTRAPVAALVIVALLAGCNGGGGRTPRRRRSTR